MGTLLRSELEDELGKFFADRTDLDSARYVRWLNLAQTRIARIHSFSELEKLSYDTTSFTGDKDVDKFLALPSGTRKVLNVRLIDGTNSRKLEGYLYKKFDKFIPYPQKYATGRPSIYTKWNNQLELWKIPDAAYRIEIRRIAWPTAFATSSDVVSDFDEKDDALIMLAVSWGHLSLRNNEDANRYWRVYKNLINDIIGEEVEKPSIDIVAFREDERLVSGTPWADPFVGSTNNGLG